jgi:LmbE family N-acetylglucosaminyl deacetylase
MSVVVVVAPHPDDETLGCGGTLLRHRAEGDTVHWVIATAMTESLGYTPEQINRRDAEIGAVAKRYRFASVTSLGFPATTLESSSRRDVVGRMSEAFARIRPEVVYLPFPGDAHSDHRVTFEAAAACCKWFRAPWVRRILSYETLSETDAGLAPNAPDFRPNVFVDVATFLEDKVTILQMFVGETGAFPFPRSAEAVRAMAAVRGAACGAEAAEAFRLLKEVRGRHS